ncbi:hypothetical protein [Congregibacter sp.]|uniref:hypothetical protein n=1 Tax=Congregibacter sp. TaxID=2744308 RepID=UPI003F6D63A2
MSHYWARFKTLSGNRFRFDTRIYLEPTCNPDQEDRVLGCIIGKNPGSATPGKRTAQLTPIVLSGDKFLPTVLSVLRKSYAAAGEPVPPGSYLQVLNLFYLCDRDLNQAKRSLTHTRRAPPCPEEGRHYPWAWYAWGGPDRLLDPLKKRFDDLHSDACFYYSRDAARIITARPGSEDLAKHTQGMPQPKVISHLAKLIRPS